MTYQDFKKKYIGKYVDYDKYYGAQCWDLGQQYFTECLGLPSYILSGCGLVSNMLVQPKRSVMDQFFNQVPITKMQQGDVVIWNWGHIAIYDHYENGKCYYFSQNPGACHIEVISEVGGYAFRKKSQAKHNIGYRSHLEGTGWQDWVFDGDTSGTTGKAKRLEAIQIDYDKEIEAKAHIQNVGWKDYGKITRNTVIGTEGKKLRLEALCLKGNFKYRVHIQNVGWSAWTEADGIMTLGSVGQSLSIEAIQIKEL
jgi:hypothetical protein